MSLQMVFLPEAFDFIAANKAEGDKLSEPMDGPTLTAYQSLARELTIWLSLGGFHLKKLDIPDSSLPQFMNCHLIINPSGEIVESYHKVHLFDVDNPENKITLRESAAVIPGDRIAPPVETPLGKIGLGIVSVSDVQATNCRQTCRKMFCFPLVLRYAISGLQHSTTANGSRYFDVSFRLHHADWFGALGFPASCSCN